ncbi:hypothetical protein VTJ04DRAFT_3613 [Mycothermus thermophilus]|uniref:uncharacterized protein n=1 Tax=Humicola insolens TaxID=85995 RepID=UPI0037445367
MASFPRLSRLPLKPVNKRKAKSHPSTPAMMNPILLPSKSHLSHAITQCINPPCTPPTLVPHHLLLLPPPNKPPPIRGFGPI